jgi:lipopolysaccharide transport system permease protein
MVIVMMRESILYGIPLESSDLTYLAIVTLILLLLGYSIFDRLEPKFAEAI